VSGRLRRDDWQVLDIPEHSEVTNALRAGHYAKGGANTSTYRHGLYRRDNEVFRGHLWGLASWIPPTKAAAAKVLPENWGGGALPVALVGR
jgi:hypothetical protein